MVAVAWQNSLPDSASYTVGENVTLSASVSGTDPFTYTWQKDGVVLVDEISASNEFSFPLGGVSESSTGAYTLTVTNEGGSISSTCVVTVADVADPLTVTSSGYNPITKQVFIRFNKSMDTTTLTSKDNYSVTKTDGTALTINAVTVGEANMVVYLDVTGLEDGNDYTLAIGSGLQSASGEALETPADKEFTTLTAGPVQAIRYLNEVDGVAYAKWGSSNTPYYDEKCPSEFVQAIWGETAATVNATEWTLIPGELVDGAYKLTIPMDKITNGGFYRLIK